MTQTVIKDGKLVGNPLGEGYDLGKLSATQLKTMQDLTAKSKSGQLMTPEDIRALSDIRKQVFK